MTEEQISELTEMIDSHPRDQAVNTTWQMDLKTQMDKPEVVNMSENVML